jgi:hypothetical protein
LLTGGGWGGAKSYDGEKALSSINHLILSELEPKIAEIIKNILKVKGLVSDGKEIARI